MPSEVVYKSLEKSQNHFSKTNKGHYKIESPIMSQCKHKKGTFEA